MAAEKENAGDPKVNKGDGGQERGKSKPGGARGSAPGASAKERNSTELTQQSTNGTRRGSGDGNESKKPETTSKKASEHKKAVQINKKSSGRRHKSHRRHVTWFTKLQESITRNLSYFSAEELPEKPPAGGASKKPPLDGGKKSWKDDWLELNVHWNQVFNSRLDYMMAMYISTTFNPMLVFLLAVNLMEFGVVVLLPYSISLFIVVLTVKYTEIYCGYFPCTGIIQTTRNVYPLFCGIGAGYFLFGFYGLYRTITDSNGIVDLAFQSLRFFNDFRKPESDEGGVDLFIRRSFDDVYSAKHSFNSQILLICCVSVILLGLLSCIAVRQFAKWGKFVFILLMVAQIVFFSTAAYSNMSFQKGKYQFSVSPLKRVIFDPNQMSTHIRKPELWSLSGLLAVEAVGGGQTLITGLSRRMAMGKQVRMYCMNQFLLSSYIPPMLAFLVINTKSLAYSPLAIETNRTLAGGHAQTRIKAAGMRYEKRMFLKPYLWMGFAYYCFATLPIGKPLYGLIIFIGTLAVIMLMWMRVYFFIDTLRNCIMEFFMRFERFDAWFLKLRKYSHGFLLMLVFFISIGSCFQPFGDLLDAAVRKMSLEILIRAALALILVMNIWYFYGSRFFFQDIQLVLREGADASIVYGIGKTFNMVVLPAYVVMVAGLSMAITEKEETELNFATKKENHIRAERMAWLYVTFPVMVGILYSVQYIVECRSERIPINSLMKPSRKWGPGELRFCKVNRYRHLVYDLGMLDEEFVKRQQAGRKAIKGHIVDDEKE